MKDHSRNERKLRCGGCANLRTICGPPCVTAPFFPPGSEADFAAVRHRFTHKLIIDTIANHPPPLARAVINFLIREARANSVPTRFHRLINAVIMLSYLHRHVTCLHIIIAALQTASVPELDEVMIGNDNGNGDLFICRGEPEEVAERSALTKPFSSDPGIKLSAPTAFNGDDPILPGRWRAR